MKVADIIIFGWIIVFLAAVMKIGVSGFTLPMRGEEFETICDRHFDETLKDGVFTSQDQAKCRSQLEADGFTVTVMQPVVNVGWLETLDFHIEGTIEVEVPNGSGGKRTQTLTKVYRNISEKKPWVLEVGD